MSVSSALIGAVLFAWFPDSQTATEPGCKYRPVFVVDVDWENMKILCAYGTSQHLDRVGLGEIMFTPEEISGLTSDTKFCLGCTKWMPLTSEYLTRNKKGGGMSILGHIPANRANDMYERLVEVMSL